MTWDDFVGEIQKLGGGVTLVGPLYSRAYQATGPTIYVDGGVQFKVGSDRHQHCEVSVGDNDSTEIPLDHVLPKDKDESDLSFVLRHLPAEVPHVELLGFLGGRRDHEVLNFGAVHYFLKETQAFRSARFDDTVIAFHGGKLSMDIRGTFTVLVFEPAFLTMTGACAYALPEQTPLAPVSSRGLGNEGFGTVYFECTAPCFIFLE